MARGRDSHEKKQQTTKQTQGRSSQSMQTTEKQGGERQTGMTRREQYVPQPFEGSPFAFMRRFTEEMDRLFADFGMGRGFLTPSLGRTFGDLGNAMWSPQVELFERNNQLIVRADLPGMTKDDIDVDISSDTLVIRGERRSEREENEEGYYRTERSYGSFYRSIPLPEGVNAENANATFRNGVLEITLDAPQRAAHGSSRRIEIREGEEREEQSRARARAAGR